MLHNFEHFSFSVLNKMNSRYRNRIAIRADPDQTTSKIDKTKVLMTNDSLMKVKSIAECSHWSILQYFLPALSIISLENFFWFF